jgi:hypothetical protein
MSRFSVSLNELTPVSEIGESKKQTLAACRQDVTAFLNHNQTASEALSPIKR